jgi:hypothetical protein
LDYAYESIKTDICWSFLMTRFDQIKYTFD